MRNVWPGSVQPNIMVFFEPGQSVRSTDLDASSQIT